ncbi:hypothetical protein MHY87_07025 [Microvirga sp. ACRRW]|uniref:hypothetical protein n=1 Tax=Microvirga sp. ACRRW TaxID=2918205 RepID=UPI001EF46145|nr:hypothetical protein [Microvirga sp. ACRRW]MCG7392654.1 hypothetical protein [Microvirga sp. ACRRW]
MDKKTKGAWVVHHGRKVAADLRGAAEYSAIDLASKAATLLARLAESDEAVLSHDQVVVAARIGGLNPKSELEPCLAQLESRRVIDRADGGVAVLGITGQTALNHAADLFDDNEPQSYERAAIDLAELVSTSPVPSHMAQELIGDNHKLTNADAADFLQRAAEIGFVDSEGDGKDRLLFNGNLFRRETAEKTKRVLDSLNTDEEQKVREFDEILRSKGCVTATFAEEVLGEKLLSKLKAAALYDMNIVSNEGGDHVLITSPGAFHKFTNPLVDDAFDHAKALVAALSYGMSLSQPERGRIWGVSLLIKKLLRGAEVGPAPAIGHDYRALEFERVVKISRVGGSFTMKLLKREVGEIALQVLQGGNGAAAALEALPSAGMRSYTPPEAARETFRKTQSPISKAQTRSLLSAVRGGGGL